MQEASLTFIMFEIAMVLNSGFVRRHFVMFIVLGEREWKDYVGGLALVS